MAGVAPEHCRQTLLFKGFKLYIHMNDVPKNVPKMIRLFEITLYQITL